MYVTNTCEFSLSFNCIPSLSTDKKRPSEKKNHNWKNIAYKKAIVSSSYKSPWAIIESWKLKLTCLLLNECLTLFNCNCLSEVTIKQQETLFAAFLISTISLPQPLCKYRLKKYILSTTSFSFSKMIFSHFFHICFSYPAPQD